MLPSAHAYTDISWELTPSGSALGVGIWNDDTLTAWAPSPLQAPLAAYSGASTDVPDGPAASRSEGAGSSVADHAPLVADHADLAGPLWHGIDTGAPQEVDQCWLTDSEAGLMGTGHGPDLAASADIDWGASPLFPEQETFFMEYVVLPALGMFLPVCVVAVLVARRRERKAATPVQHLLQV